MPQCPTCSEIVPDYTELCDNCGMELKSSFESLSKTGSAKLSQQVSLAPPEEAISSPNIASLSLAQRPSSQEQKLATRSTTGSAQLTLKRGNTLTTEIFQIGEYVVIGRFDPETGPVDVDLGNLPEAEYVSRQHAEIKRDSTGQWFVKDLETRNGTFLKAVGQPKFTKVVDEQAINDGDEIALGNARFEFRLV